MTKALVRDLLSLSAAAVMLLTGCGSNETDAGAARSDSSSKAVTTATTAAETTASAKTTAAESSAAESSAAETKADEVIIEAVTTSAVTETSSSVTDLSDEVSDIVPDLTPKFKDLGKQTISVTDKGKYTEINSLDYYYNTIDDLHKRMYLAIYDVCIHTNEAGFKAYLSVPQELITEFSDDFYMVFACVMEDYPEFYSFDESAYILWDYVSRELKDGRFEVYAYQSEPIEGFEREQEELNEAANEFLSGLDLTGSEYDIALRIHDKLIDTVVFGKEDNEKDRIHAQSAYGALINHRAVCEGYSDAFSYLLRRCGIMCLPIEGGAHADNTYESAVEEASKPDSDHAWNLMRLDGKWYEADLLWDDIDPDDYSGYVMSLIDGIPGLLEKRKHLFWARTTEEMSDITEFDDYVYYTDSDGEEYSLAHKHAVHLRASDPRAAYYHDSGSYNYRALSEMLPEAK